MKFLKKDAVGKAVQKLQYFLSLAMPDANIIETEVFDVFTESAVRTFQEKKGLGVDGRVGNNTWAAIFKEVYQDDFFSHQITNQFLTSNEFYHDIHAKNAIYLHHTAGNFNPKSTLKWWEIDHYNDGSTRHISTAFVLGRRSSIVNQESEEYDGKTYRSFNEIKWAHHLGYSHDIDRATIGLEICAFGWLYKDDNGFYYQADKKKNTQKVYLREEEVYQFKKPWRGQKYFEKYTEKQIAETKRLILTLAYLFDIDLPNTTYNRAWFELNDDALAGKPGLWTHVNVRKDKTDCFPQPELIDMLNTLHEAQKDFKPILKESDIPVEEEIAAEEVPEIAREEVPEIAAAEEILLDEIVPGIIDTAAVDSMIVIDKSISIKGLVPSFEMEDLFRVNDL